MMHHTPPRSMQELVDLHSGCISREIFVNEDIYQQGASAGLRPYLALYRPREPDSQTGRLLRDLYG